MGRGILLPRREASRGRLEAANSESLTLAAGSVVAWSALVAVCPLEVGFAHAHPHPRVLATGVAFRPTSVAITVCRGTQQATTQCCRLNSVPQKSGKGLQ